MLEVPEYELDGFDQVLQESDVISPGEAKWFRRQLERIAGKNPHGEPHLALRWGPTYQDPTLATKSLKYIDCVHYGKELGERRWIIEIWRSPEFLKRSGRYQQINDPDTVNEFYFCKACGAEIKVSQDVLNVLGSVPPCDRCGSRRVQTELIRESGQGRLLNEFPSNGCYDYWLRLERANLTYHPLDREALTVCEALWKWELLPQNERDAIESADREIERRQMILAQRQQTGRAPQFGSGLITV